MLRLDHLVLPVSDLEETVAFFTEVLGCSYEGQSGPFSIIRVATDFTIQLAPWETSGGMHLAFALDPGQFEAVFARVRARGIPYGDAFHTVGSMQGPGDEVGARGPGKALYMFDPNRHLIEIRHYGE